MANHTMMDPNAFPYTLTQGNPKITLIGMSGLGKSHWSKSLERAGFRRFCCDNMIADLLLESCTLPGGKIDCLGQWMGFPFDSGYTEKANIYLQAEIEVLGKIIAYLETSPTEEKVVIDTTGSAPYAGDAAMQRLGALTYMVHLATSPAAVANMIANYVRSPRPVLWGDSYRRQAGETETESLARCYPRLLSFRETLYRRYAHYSVPYDLHRI